MALFDYRRKIEQPDPELDKEKDKEVQVESSVYVQPNIDETKAIEEVPFEAPPSANDMVILRQVPTDVIKSSVKPGILRVDFPDKESQTNVGSMFVQTEDIHQSLTNDNRPIPGKADVVISHDGESLDSYFIVKNGSFIRSDKSLDLFVEDWNKQQKERSDSARKAIEEQDVQQTEVKNTIGRSMGYE